MGKRILVSSLCLLLFVLVGAALVYAANVTVDINVPAVNGSYLSGNVVINVTFSGQVVNITNVSFSVLQPDGTFIDLFQNGTGLNQNHTEFLFTWNTANGTFSDGAGYQINITVNHTNQSGGRMWFGESGLDTGGFNISFLRSGLIVDNTNPNATAKFRDSNNNIKTKFTFGSKVLVDCQTNDKTAGLNTTRNTIRVRYPSISSFQNITITTNTNTTLKGEIKVEDTRLVGSYIVECVVVDRAGNTNLSNKTFTIERLVISGSSIFATDDWVPPISKKVIGKGTVEDFGVLPESGEARLIAKKGGITFTIGGHDVTITVEDIDANSADLDIKNIPTSLTLSESETKQIDTNNDGYDDLEIFLNKIHTNKADLLFKEIYVPVQTPPEPSVPERDDTITPVVVPKEDLGLGWLWFLLVLLLVIIIIMFVVHKISRGNEEGGGPSRIRFTPKDLGMQRDDRGYGLGRTPSPGTGGNNTGSGGSFY